MAPSTASSTSSTSANDGGGGGGYLRSTTNYVARSADVQGPERVEMRGRVSKSLGLWVCWYWCGTEADAGAGVCVYVCVSVDVGVWVCRYDRMAVRPIVLRIDARVLASIIRHLPKTHYRA